MARKRQPQRSCVVCRSKQDKIRLKRLVFAQGRLQVDESGKMSGRGAYLCADKNCWRQAAAQPIVGKALRRSLSDDDRETLRQLAPS